MNNNKVIKNRTIKKLWSQRYLYLFLLPAIIWVIVICYGPMVGLYMSFVNYIPTGKPFLEELFTSQFVGLDWFKYFFQNSDFAIIMRNTLGMSFLTILLSFPAPIILALALNEVKNLKFKKFVQTSSYLPYFISWVIASNIFITILSGDGVINNILMGLGLVKEPVYFFQEGKYFWWIIAFANTWKIMGYNAIIYLASISGIDQQQYEAADIDGATRLQKMWYITLAALKPTISILLILAIGNLMNAGFEQQLIMQNDSIMDYADVIDTYVFRYGLRKGEFSYASAVGMFKSIVSFTLLSLANIITKKFGEEGLF
ncbi:MAG TPA: protein lplB [Lachnoclostridium phytofermentans]|uniref:Protein lplB n=1 Tax=Lachnoclostridium phytofermentans TaxID=66219 RepID=A0A3D2X2R5_9FIRM|nr:ABC transporter permease subunit [Lachnoclostridium sp.]HCL01430.1 protein lplB [Lachnoclostridium phytofermentans]